MAVTLAVQVDGYVEDARKIHNRISHTSPAFCITVYPQKGTYWLLVCNCRVIFQRATYPFQGKIITSNLAAEEFT